MKTIVQYALRASLWTVVACVSGGFVSMVILIDQEGCSDHWRTRISAGRLLALLLLNCIVIPAVIYSTARWWNRRCKRNPSLLMQMALHVLVAMIVLPWLLAGALSLFASLPYAERVTVAVPIGAIMMLLTGGMIVGFAFCWRRFRHSRTTAFIRVITYALIMGMLVPWCFPGSYRLIRLFLQPQYIMCYVSEAVALVFLAFLVIGAALRVRRWDPYCTIRLLLVGGIILWLRWDAPPPTSRFSWNDLPDPPDAAQAREVLIRIGKNSPRWYAGNTKYSVTQSVSHLIGCRLSCAEILSNTAAIEANWNASAGYWDVMARLGTFSAVPELSREVNRTINHLQLRRATQLLVLYAQMKACQGNAEQGVSNLVQFYSVTRKALPYSSILVSKMVWIACAGFYLEAANQIAQLPDTKPETLQALAAAFTPLRTEEITLRSAYIGEICRTMDEIVTNVPETLCFFNVSPWHRRFMAFLLYNPNATLKGYLSMFEPAVDSMSVLPMKYDRHKQLALIEELDWRMHVKNMVGYHFYFYIVPGFCESARRANICKVKSDLLALYLHKRLNKALVVNDIFSGKPYLTDDSWTNRASRLCMYQRQIEETEPPGS